MDKTGKKSYGDCPTCGSTLEIYSGRDGTNSFEAVDIKSVDTLLEKLKSNQVDLPSEVNEYLNKHFWELI